MSLLNRPGGCVGLEPTIIRYEDGTAPPVIGNVVTIPRPGGQSAWAGRPGPGIDITHPTPDSAQGHTPTISVRTSPVSPVPVTFDASGRLTVGPVDVAGQQTALLVNGGTAIQGGLTVSQGGVKGHAVSVAVAPSSAASSRVWIGPDGGLAVDPPTPFVWEVVTAAGDTRTLKLKNTTTGASITLGTV